MNAARPPAASARSIGLRDRARRAARGALLGLLALAAHAAEPAMPFKLEPPPFMSGPSISRSLMGSTYAYTSPAPGSDTRLMITTMPAGEIRKRFGALTDLQCLNLFLGELKSEHEGFFVVAMNQPLALGPATLLRFRWNGVKAGRTMTGVLSCGELEGYYYVIHFVDEIRAAMRTFPAIRASLRALATRAP